MPGRSELLKEPKVARAGLATARRTRFAKVANSAFNATPPSKATDLGAGRDGELSNAELKDPSALGFK
jgi:hypothetical protein